MKMIFKGIIANLGIDRNGNRLTKKALKQLAKQATNIPIGFEFNPSIFPIYGKIISATVKGDELIAEAEVDKPDHEVRMYIAPSFRVIKCHKEDTTTILDEVDLIEMSLTSQPADRHLTPINWE